MTRPAAIILAGSHIWNPSSLESLCPRALLPIANTPLILHTLYWLRDAGIETAVICANDAGHALQHLLGDGSRLGLDLYFYEDHVPRGPAGCVRDAGFFTAADQLIVVEGSILPGVSLDEVLETHLRANVAATVVVNDNDEPTGAPDKTAMSPAGVYVFERSAVEEIPGNSYQDIKETFIPKLIRSGQQVAVHVAEHALPWVNALDSYLAAQGWVLDRCNGTEPFLCDYVWQDSAFVHREAELASGARVVGPILVGPNSRIESGAIVIGPVVLGHDCRVASNAIVERSVFWDHAVIERGARCDLTLLARNAVLRERVAEQFSIVSPHLHPRRGARVVEGVR